MPWSAAGGCAARPGKRPAIRHLRGSAAAEPSRPALVSTRCPANDPPARSGRRRLGTGGLPCGGAGSVEKPDAPTRMSASHWSGFLEFHVAMLLGRRFQAADVMAVGVFDFAEALAVLRAELVAEDGEEPRGQASAKADYFFRPQSPAGPAVAAVSGAARDSVEGTAPGPAPVIRLVRIVR